MEVHRLVVGQLQTNCYLVWDKKTQKTLIIDPADDGDYLIQKIKDFNLVPVLIVVTHGHFDHVLAVTELKLAYGIPFWMNKADLTILKRVQPTTKYFTGNQTDPASMPDKFIKEGDIIKFGKESLSVIESPGHTPGGVALYAKGVLFSGDTLFADGVGRSDLSLSSPSALKASLNKLFQLPSRTKVYPGHGNISSLDKILIRLKNF